MRRPNCRRTKRRREGLSLRPTASKSSVNAASTQTSGEAACRCGWGAAAACAAGEACSCCRCAGCCAGAGCEPTGASSQSGKRAREAGGGSSGEQLQLQLPQPAKLSQPSCLQHAAGGSCTAASGVGSSTGDVRRVQPANCQSAMHINRSSQPLTHKQEVRLHSVHGLHHNVLVRHLRCNGRPNGRCNGQPNNHQPAL